jgi:hypothetical protein
MMREFWSRAVMWPVLLIGAGAACSAARAAVAPPALVSGEVSGNAVTIGSSIDSPTIKFAFTAPGTLVGYSFTFTAPHGAIYTIGGGTVQANFGFGGYLPPAGTSGTIFFSQTYNPMSLYAEAGKWNLTSAVLADAAGNTTHYTAAQLAAVFSSVALTVKNAGPQDFVPPVISAGKLLNRIVSLSSPFPYLGVQMTVTDNLSGAVEGSLFLNLPDGKPYLGFFAGDPLSQGSGTYGPAPVKKGAYQFGAGIVAGSPTGTWTITGYQVCDYAGNCVTDMNSADVEKLFGTTHITVTK